jgi:hypothetical protein
MSDFLGRSSQLKQALVDFVFGAEGELSVALETFSKNKFEVWSKVQAQSQNHSSMAIDMFLSDGRIKGQTPIDWFIDNSADLDERDRQLLKSWNHSFNGLFEVLQISDSSYDLMNWLTTKRYRVLPNGLQDDAKLARLKAGEILLTRISPLTEEQWIFSGPMELLGKLGKPKLAVAIGNFKDRFKQHLYGDAPELLEESWQSVELYYQEFVDFFGASEITMLGRDFNQRFQCFQDILSEKQLQRAGIDSSQSLQDLAKASEVSQEEIEAMATELDESSAVASQLLNSGRSIKMVMPKVDLPKPLQRAKHLTVIVHPRWGHCLLDDYQVLCDRLSQDADSLETESLDQQVKRYLAEPTIHPYVWQKLVEQYPEPLEAALQRVLAQPSFQIQRDLQPTLQEYGKPAEPELPETASVPAHLNSLFKEALAEVEQPKGKTKKKAKAKAKTGFGAR